MGIVRELIVSDNGLVLHDVHRSAELTREHVVTYCITSSCGVSCPTVSDRFMCHYCIDSPNGVANRFFWHSSCVILVSYEK